MMIDFGRCGHWVNERVTFVEMDAHHLDPDGRHPLLGLKRGVGRELI